MKKQTTILVTGVGAIIGYGILNILRKNVPGVRLIGTDIYPDAVGQHFCNKFIQAHRFDAPDFFEFFEGIILDNDVDLVFFGTEQEMYKVADSRERLAGIYEKFVLNTPEIIHYSLDKYSTFQFLTSQGLPAIPSRIDGNYEETAKEFGTPFLLKLRHSYASKGMAVIENEEDFVYWRKKAGDQFMVQKLIGDKQHEYTAAVFGLGDGTSLRPFILKRQLSGEGATAKAEVIESPEMEEQIRKLVALLKPKGPTNFQFRKHDGVYYLLEFNPRISSATSIRAAFNYKEPVMCLDFYLHKQIPTIESLRKGHAVRYIADWIDYVS